MVSPNVSSFRDSQGHVREVIEASVGYGLLLHSKARLFLELKERFFPQSGKRTWGVPVNNIETFANLFSFPNEYPFFYTLTNTVFVKTQVKKNWETLGLMKLGVTPLPNVCAGVTLGVALTTAQVKRTFSCALTEWYNMSSLGGYPPNDVTSNSFSEYTATKARRTFVGYALGVFAEHQLSTQWTGTMEVLYVRYGGRTLLFSEAMPMATTVKLSNFVGTVGLKYRFVR